MNSVLYARSEPVVLRMACPHCHFVSRYDVDFIAETIKDNKSILCVACEERFEIVLQKVNAAEHSAHTDAGKSADLQAVSNADNESTSQAVA